MTLKQVDKLGVKEPAACSPLGPSHDGPLPRAVRLKTEIFIKGTLLLDGGYCVDLPIFSDHILQKAHLMLSKKSLICFDNS